MDSERREGYGRRREREREGGLRYGGDRVDGLEERGKEEE